MLIKEGSTITEMCGIGVRKAILFVITAAMLAQVVEPSGTEVVFPPPAGSFKAALLCCAFRAGAEVITLAVLLEHFACWNTSEVAARCKQRTCRSAGHRVMPRHCAAGYASAVNSAVKFWHSSHSMECILCLEGSSGHLHTAQRHKFCIKVKNPLPSPPMLFFFPWQALCNVHGRTSCNLGAHRSGKQQPDLKALGGLSSHLWSLLCVFLLFE